jgi:uncharacterized protein (DUF302 family)
MEPDMRKLFLTVIALFFCVQLAYADNGLVNVKSHHSVKVTADRLEKIIKNKGMTLFNRINHAEAAQKIGKQLRPTELLIFGNPKVGTPLIQCEQSVAIDLPQKALIWQDDEGQVWLTYNDPEYIARRHGMTDCQKIRKKIANALQKFATAATKP